MMIRICLVIMSLFATTGCAFFLDDRIHYTWSPEAATHCTTCTPTVTDPHILGIALSGGGSRASVYGAAALEVLAEAGFLQQATYVSSVSGGSFPATYYALTQPQPCPPTSDQDICESADFAAFKQAMRVDFLSAMTGRQIARPGRISSPTRRLTSLQEALDEAFLGGAQFGDLPPRPILLINGARYDDARRFVFSNQAIPEADSDIGPFTHPTLRSASFSLPGCTRATPPHFSVALATAISAAFPPILGPAAMEVPDGCDGGQPQYWHLGDGGILDNTGVETIEDYALRASTNTERVLIFAVDAGRSVTTQQMLLQRNLNLWTTDPGRVVEIVNKRADAYRAVALAQLATSRGVQIDIIPMRYVDAELAAWPVTCGPRTGGGEAIRAELARIPTSLRITDCHADLMEAAARDVVQRALKSYPDQIAPWRERASQDG